MFGLNVFAGKSKDSKIDYVSEANAVLLRSIAS